MIPDLVVEKVDDKYVVYLNDKNIPRLRINHVYQEELMKDSKDGDRETREFIQSRLKSARWLIQTIEQRRRTMVKVMECIVDKQREFFEKGTAFLRPLTLQQVASEINMHESTVSRVTTNKYVQTPRGVFELKFFFSSSLGTQDGGRDIRQERQGHDPPDHRAGRSPESFERSEDSGYAQERRAQHRPANRGEVPRAARNSPGAECGGSTDERRTHGAWRVRRDSL